MDVTYTKRRKLNTDTYIWKKMIALSRCSRLAGFVCLMFVAAYLFVRDLLFYAYYNQKRVMAAGMATCLIIVSSFSACPKTVLADEISDEPVVQSDAEPVIQPDPEPVVQPDTEPAVQPDTEPTVQPDTEPVVQPDTEPTVPGESMPPQLNIVLEPKLPQAGEGAQAGENGTFSSAYITFSNLTENSLSNINIQSDQFDIIYNEGSYQLVVRNTDENGNSAVPGDENAAESGDGSTSSVQDFIALIGIGDSDKSCKVEVSLPENMTWEEFKQLMSEAAIIDSEGYLQFEIEGAEQDDAAGEGEDVSDSNPPVAENDQNQEGDSSSENDVLGEDQPLDEDADADLSDEEMEDVADGEELLEEDALGEEELAEEESEEEEEEAEEPLEEKSPFEPGADSVIVQRVGGYSMGGTFFALGGGSYRLVLAEGEDVYRLGVSEVYYQYGEEVGVASVVGGVAEVPIPETVNAELLVYYYNYNGEQVLLFSEYVVNEMDAPLINYERVNKNGIQYLHVTMVEQGEVKSGISEAQIMVDGEVAQLPLSNILKSVELASGQSVPTILEYNIELDTDEEHQFEITAFDYAGNTNIKEFSMSALSTEVVSVVLPTTFKINILPYEDDWQVIGEDITICNCSDFPISVSIDHTNVEVNKIPTDRKLVQQQLDISSDDSEPLYNLNEYAAGEKNCDLRLDLALNGEEIASYAIPEGDGEFLTSFELAQHMEDTDVEGLKQMAYDREVTSADYACVRLRGYLEKGSEALWAGGDLKVTLVFNFSKAAPTEEQLEAIDENMILLEDVMEHEIPEPIEQTSQPIPADASESEVNLDMESQPVTNDGRDYSQEAAAVSGE